MNKSTATNLYGNNQQYRFYQSIQSY